MRETIPLTADGYQKLKNELDDLRSNARPQVIADIASARAHGDLKENAEYHAAKEKQSFIEGRILLLEDRLARSKVITLDGEDLDRVKFGTFVTLEEENGVIHTYQLVGDLEVDVNANKISISSPIGRAIIGKKLNDEVDIVVPKGRILYTITAITF